MHALERRLERLEAPEGRDPRAEDWLAVLNAPDQDAALADLNRRYPGPRSAAYQAWWASLG